MSADQCIRTVSVRVSARQHGDKRGAPTRSGRAALEGPEPQLLRYVTSQIGSAPSTSYPEEMDKGNKENKVSPVAVTVETEFYCCEQLQVQLQVIFVSFITEKPASSFIASTEYLAVT